MSSSTRVFISGLSSLALVLGAVVLTATPASACTLTANVPSSSGSTDKVHYGGTGTSCTKTASNGDLDVSLYHYYAPPIPDYRVNDVYDGSGTTGGGYSGNWSVSGAQCDNGGSTTYYDKIAFIIMAGDVQTGPNSANRTINHC